MPNDDAVERLSKKLDSSKESINLKRSTWYSHGEATPHGWKPEPEVVRPQPVTTKMQPVRLLFFGSIVFFVLALVVAALLFWGGNNTVSARNVDIQITGPTHAAAGSTLSLQIVVTNRNAVAIENADLILEFPEGTRSDKDVSVELPRIRESLGTIESGKSVSRTVRAVLFGVQGADLDVKASVEYHVPSSNATFVSDALYTTRINESPAAILIDALKETISGQYVSYTVSVTSNAPELLPDMLLIAQYPPGFSFDSSSPEPSVGNAIWNLGDIEPGGTRAVTIRGTYSGEDGESRVTHFMTGHKKGNQDDQIAAPLATSNMALTIEKPFVSVALALDGNTAETHAISRGQEIVGTVHWTNNLPIRVQNVSIKLMLDGQVLDRTKVKVSDGFFNSSTNTILWDKSTDNRFADVAPGESGSETFSFAAFSPNQGIYKNAVITISATVQGNRLTELNVPEVVQSTASTQAVVLSDLSLNAFLSRGAGDSGTMPPRADMETVYTVTWQVTNSGNALANTQVSGILPSYVRYIGNPVPAGENLSFNTTGRSVAWTIGDMAVGQSKTISFKVGFTPSVSQVHLSPVVISDQEVSGLDRFVRYTIQYPVLPLSIKEAASSPSEAVVVP